MRCLSGARHYRVMNFITNLHPNWEGMTLLTHMFIYHSSEWRSVLRPGITKGNTSIMLTIPCNRIQSPNVYIFLRSLLYLWHLMETALIGRRPIFQRPKVENNVHQIGCIDWRSPPDDARPKLLNIFWFTDAAPQASDDNAGETLYTIIYTTWKCSTTLKHKPTEQHTKESFHLFHGQLISPASPAEVGESGTHKTISMVEWSKIESRRLMHRV